MVSIRLAAPRAVPPVFPFPPRLQRRVLRSLESNGVLTGNSSFVCLLLIGHPWSAMSALRCLKANKQTRFSQSCLLYTCWRIRGSSTTKPKLYIDLFYGIQQSIASTLESRPEKTYGNTCASCWFQKDMNKFFFYLNTANYDGRTSWGILVVDLVPFVAGRWILYLVATVIWVPKLTVHDFFAGHASSCVISYVQHWYAWKEFMVPLGEPVNEGARLYRRPRVWWVPRWVESVNSVSRYCFCKSDRLFPPISNHSGTASGMMLFSKFKSSDKIRERFGQIVCYLNVGRVLRRVLLRNFGTPSIKEKINCLGVKKYSGRLESCAVLKIANQGKINWN